jgi:hypothetical protein
MEPPPEAVATAEAPPADALRRWEDERLFVVEADWILYLSGGEAAWHAPDWVRAGWARTEQREFGTWAVARGDRVIVDGAELAALVGVTSACHSREIRWTEKEAVATFTPPGGPLTLVPIYVQADRHADLPQRPDECLDRAPIERAVTRFDEALLQELGLGPWRDALLPEPPPPPPARLPADLLPARDR